MRISFQNVAMFQAHCKNCYNGFKYESKTLLCFWIISKYLPVFCRFTGGTAFGPKDAFPLLKKLDVVWALLVILGSKLSVGKDILVMACNEGGGSAGLGSIALPWSAAWGIPITNAFSILDETSNFSSMG